MTPNVALVSMPWAPISEPSLALGILKAELTRSGIPTRIFHSSLGLLRHVTGPAYQQISACWALNEFAFSGVFDPTLSDSQMTCLMERCFAHTDTDDAAPFATANELGEAIIELRHRLVPQYLAECAEEILSFQPTMVGFTCMFDQTLASAALSWLIKQARPETLVVFGGYALEGPPGETVFRAFPHIDAIAIGDGEPLIVPLARASVEPELLSTVPQLRARRRTAPSGPQFRLQDSPDPDYSDWFHELSALQAEEQMTVRTTVLPIESSRGCWWGQKQHCVFCGIDDGTLSYRSKSADHVLDMLARMRRRYGPEMPFRFSDYILPHNFMTELLPRLADIEPRYVLHSEIKANQNEERIKAFAAAGFGELQPGIESFDSQVLKLMKKGVTGIQNVHLLKLGYEHGIQINYNILYGMPGDQPEWYLAMIEQLPRLYHLTPPVTRTETVVTRFAPLHTTPAQFGFDGPVRHHRCYDVLFSQPFLEQSGFGLDDYAYYFDRYFNYDPRNLPLYTTLVHEVDHWKKQHLVRDVVLTWTREGGRLRMRDTRFGGDDRYELGAGESIVYDACDRAPQTRESLLRHTSLSATAIESALDELDARRLIWRGDDRVLGLATPEAIAAAHCARGWTKVWTALYA